MARRTIEHADSFRIGICEDPRCHALHVALVDGEGDVFACMTVAAKDVGEITEAMRDMAYEVVTMKMDDGDVHH